MQICQLYQYIFITHALVPFHLSESPCTGPGFTASKSPLQVRGITRRIQVQATARGVASRRRVRSRELASWQGFRCILIYVFWKIYSAQSGAPPGSAATSQCVAGTSPINSASTQWPCTIFCVHPMHVTKLMRTQRKRL